MTQRAHNRLVALVVGGSGGIGRASVMRFAERGWDVALTFHRHEGPAEEAAQAARAMGSVVRVYSLDITNPDAVTNVVQQCHQEFGRLDAVVHSAGVGRRCDFAGLTSEEWERTVATNLTSAFWLARAAVPILSAQRSGSIIFIGSLSARIGGVVNAAYAASKAGLIGLTKYLAQELGPYNVRVNVVAPGLVETELFQTLNVGGELTHIANTIPLRRFASAPEVGAVVEFLASQHASYITGECLFVSGGR